MRRAWVVLVVGGMCTPLTARAGNSDEVNAGIDVTLSGGAVVASVYTGAALWYNPAGIARIDKTSLELTGATLQVQMIDAPGLLSLSTGEQSEGKTTNLSVIPEAITFTSLLRPNLKLGVGLFNSSIRRVLVTEEVTSTEGASPIVEAVGGQSSRVDFFHISTGLAAEFGRAQKFLFGGAFDFVVANRRLDGTFAVSYDGGEEGFFTDGEVVSQTGFGLQLKAGFQWVPIKQLRVGLSVTSPTYVFALLERFASTFGQAPPGETTDPDNPQASQSEEVRNERGGWWGVEPGNMRVGIAYVGAWGWVEADLVVHWRLRTPDLGIDFNGTINGRIGSAFRLSKLVRLGIGFFTDVSQTDELGGIPNPSAPFAATDVDFYGVHVGFLFSNQETDPARPNPDKDGIGLSIAIGVRYAHGRGDVLSIIIPAGYDPAALQPVPVSAKINEIAINFGAKVAF